MTNIVDDLRGTLTGHANDDEMWERVIREREEAAAEITRLRAALLHTLASLEAAISLLEHGGKAAKKAAPSDKMFDQMLKDYRTQADKARAALEERT